MACVLVFVTIATRILMRNKLHYIRTKLDRQTSSLYTIDIKYYMQVHIILEQPGSLILMWYVTLHARGTTQLLAYFSNVPTGWVGSLA